MAKKQNNDEIAKQQAEAMKAIADASKAKVKGLIDNLGLTPEQKEKMDQLMGLYPDIKKYGIELTQLKESVEILKDPAKLNQYIEAEKTAGRDTAQLEEVAKNPEIAIKENMKAITSITKKQQKLLGEADDFYHYFDEGIYANDAAKTEQFRALDKAYEEAVQATLEEAMGIRQPTAAQQDMEFHFNNYEQLKAQKEIAEVKYNSKMAEIKIVEANLDKAIKATKDYLDLVAKEKELVEKRTALIETVEKIKQFKAIRHEKWLEIKAFPLTADNGEVLANLKKIYTDLQHTVAKYLTEKHLLVRGIAKLEDEIDKLNTAIKNNPKVKKLQKELDMLKAEAEKLRIEIEQKNKFMSKDQQAMDDITKKRIEETKEKDKEKGKAKDDDKNKDDNKQEKKELDKGKIINDYVRLLRANEKWRNHTRIKFFRGRAKTSGLNDSELIGKDGKFTAEADAIRERFVAYTQQVLASQTGATPKDIKDAQVAAMKKIYEEINAEMHDQRRLIADKIRHGKWLWGRIAVGAALFGVGVLMGGWIGALALGVAGIVGAAGRFLGVDGIMDKVHGYLSGSKATERGIANKVMYKSKEEKRNAAIDKLYSGKEVDAAEVDNGFIAATTTLSKYRFWKRLTAVAAVVLPIAIVKYFGFEHTDAPQKPDVIDNQPVKPPVIHTYPDHYVVPDGKGYWTIAEKILQDRLGDKFNSLPTGEKNSLITFMQHYLIDNHAKLDIMPNEMHPHIGAGAPWLNKGADLFFKDADWQTAYAQFIKAGKQIPKALLAGNTANQVTSSLPKVFKMPV